MVEIHCVVYVRWCGLGSGVRGVMIGDIGTSCYRPGRAWWVCQLKAHKAGQS